MTDRARGLERFVDAQAGVYAAVEAELRAGRKRTHWMWFVFPQMRGLGASATAHRFGIESFSEARAYLAHPLLGKRLRGAVGLVLGAPPGHSALDVFGTPDDRKFHSSLTLFALAAGDRTTSSGAGSTVISRAGSTQSRSTPCARTRHSPPEGMKRPRENRAATTALRVRPTFWSNA